jgi:hypothetical protein
MYIRAIPNVNVNPNVNINPNINVNPNLDANFDANFDANIGADFDANISNINTDANINTNANANVNANTNVNADANVNANTNANVNANTNANVNANTNANVNANTNANVNADANVNANTNANVNANTNANVNADANVNANTNANVNADANVNTDANVNANANANLDQNANAQQQGFLRRNWGKLLGGLSALGIAALVTKRFLDKNGKSSETKRIYNDKDGYVVVEYTRSIKFCKGDTATLSDTTTDPNLDGEYDIKSTDGSYKVTLDIKKKIDKEGNGKITCHTTWDNTLSCTLVDLGTGAAGGAGNFLNNFIAQLLDKLGLLEFFDKVKDVAKAVLIGGAVLVSLWLLFKVFAIVSIFMPSRKSEPSSSSVQETKQVSPSQRLTRYRF